LEETKFLKLNEIETPGLPNTILLDNSLCFPMVHFTTPNGQWITNYGYQRMAGWPNRGNLSRLDLPTQFRILVKFHLDLFRNIAYEKCR
jgi:hypothetical protein